MTKPHPFLTSHYTDVLALSKLFCIIGEYPAIQKQIVEIWPSIKTCSRITNDMTLDECLKAFDMNIEEAEEMKSEWETDVETASEKLEEKEEKEEEQKNLIEENKKLKKQLKQSEEKYEKLSNDYAAHLNSLEEEPVTYL